jgi:terminase small subunit / prophage DNA-packing protein
MTTVNLQQACEHLGKSPNTLKAWFKRGCPVQIKGNQKTEWKIALADVLRWREEQAINEAISDLPDDIEQLKIRKLKAETLLIEIEAAKKRGEVALLEEVERVMTAMAIEIRTGLLLIPQRLASQIVNLNSSAEVQKLMTEEITLVLTALSEMEIN